MAARRLETAKEATNVAVQQALFMGVVECTPHSGDDAQDLISWHSSWIPVGEKASRVGVVDEVHRDPELSFVLTSVMDAHDVRVPQLRGEVGLAVEAGAVVGVSGYVGGAFMSNQIGNSLFWPRKRSP
jgi:hypothetical protein